MVYYRRCSFCNSHQKGKTVMASQEHLDKLNEGVEVWNAWREKNPRVIPDLADASLE
jgi:hypothetical protein